MTLTKKIIKEFEKKFGGRYCDGKCVLFNDVIPNFLLSSLHKVATEAIEAVRLIKQNTKLPKTLECLKENIDGYNSAITEMEQKAKKFLLDNF